MTTQLHTISLLHFARRCAKLDGQQTVLFGRVFLSNFCIIAECSYLICCPQVLACRYTPRDRRYTDRVHKNGPVQQDPRPKIPKPVFEELRFEISVSDDNSACGTIEPSTCNQLMSSLNLRMKSRSGRKDVAVVVRCCVLQDFLKLVQRESQMAL